MSVLHCSLTRLPHSAPSLLPVCQQLPRRFKYNPGKLRQKKANTFRFKRESDRVAELKQIRTAFENLEKAEREAPGPPPLPRIGHGALRKMAPERRLEYEDLKEFGPVPGDQTLSIGSRDSGKPAEISFLADSILHVATSPVPERLPRKALEGESLKSLLSLRVAFKDLNELDEQTLSNATEHMDLDLNSSKESPAEQLSKDTSQPTLTSVNKIIYSNALLGRLDAANSAFDLLPDLGLKPDVRSHNGLIFAHVRAKDLRGAVSCFRALEDSGLKPNVHSFGTLIKGCIDAGQLPSAYGLYEDLKARGLAPNLHIFTTLIAGCIDSSDLARAWKTFDHARGILNIVPDRDLYNTMIAAAGKEGNAERAMDLLVEMQEKGIAPSAVVYNSLIAVCAKREDYRVESFKMFARMLGEEMPPTVVTYDALINTCCAAGDLLGARDLWNAATGEGIGKVEVDGRMVTSLMKAYTHALGDWFQHLRKEGGTAGKKHRRFVREIGVAEQSGPLEQPVHKVLPFGEWLERRRLAIKADMDGGSDQGEVPEHRQRPNFHDISISYDEAVAPVRLAESWDDEVARDPPVYQTPDSVAPAAVILKFPDGCEDTALAFPTLEHRIVTEDNLIAEARAFFNWAVRRNGRLLQQPEAERSGDLPLTNALVEHYIRLHARHPVLLLSLPETMDLLESLLPQGDWDGRTRFTVAIAMTNDPRLMRRHGRQRYESLIAWDAKREAELEKLGLSPGERERRREREGRGRKAWTEGFVSLANGRARLGDVEGAFTAIEDLHNFRYPFYLSPPDHRVLAPLFRLCRDIAEDGDPEPLKKLRRMVPEPAESPLEEVQRVLRKKWVGSQWWGWEAMGVGKRRVLEYEDKVRRDVRMIKGGFEQGDLSAAVMARLGGDRRFEKRIEGRQEA